jgi:hypothetical protein
MVVSWSRQAETLGLVGNRERVEAFRPASLQLRGERPDPVYISHARHRAASPAESAA